MSERLKEIARLRKEASEKIFHNTLELKKAEIEQASALRAKELKMKKEEIELTINEKRHLAEIEIQKADKLASIKLREAQVKLLSLRTDATEKSVKEKLNHLKQVARKSAPQ